MADIDGLDELEQVRNGVEEFADRQGKNSANTTIESTIRRLFDREVLPAVQARAREHVGGYAEDIDEGSLGWAGGQYRHGLGSDSVVVRSHEYGSGRHNPDGSSDLVDGRAGYRIPAGTDDGPIVVNGNVVEYVVHPGVEAQRFMRRTVEEYDERVADDLGDELVDALEDAIDL